MAKDYPEIENINDITIPASDKYWSTGRVGLEDMVGMYDIPTGMDTVSNIDLLLVSLLNHSGVVIDARVIKRYNNPYITFQDDSLKVDGLGLLADTFDVKKGEYSISISGFRNYIYKGLSEDENDVPQDVDPYFVTVTEIATSGFEIRVQGSPGVEESFERFSKTQLPSTMPDGETAADALWPAILFVNMNKQEGTALRDPLTKDYIRATAFNWLPIPHTSPAGNINQSIIFKLGNRYDGQVGDRIHIMRPLFLGYTIGVSIDIKRRRRFEIETLRGPNLQIEAADRVGAYTNFKTFNDITGGDPATNQLIVDKFISGSNIIDLNLDFRDYSKFIHFGSAEEKLKTFQYKLQEIQYYESKSSGVSADLTGLTGAGATSSVYLLANKAQYDSEKATLISNFDDYEHELYYGSGSTISRYLDDGIVNYNSHTWPKSNASKPYTNLSVTASAATTWYNNQIYSASLYDQSNPSGLRNTIPTHVRVDPANANYILLYDMMGTYFDNFYNYIKMLENINKREESVFEGMSKDLIYDLGKSLGWTMQSGFDGEELWSYLLGTDASGSYQVSGSGETLTYVKKESYGRGDLEKQTWKRILNNLPLLLKSKGTTRGLRALLASYGIPDTILRIDEFGGPVSGKKGYRRSLQKFNYGLNFTQSTAIRIPHAQIDYDKVGMSLTAGSANRYPSMYEFRTDTSHTASCMHLTSLSSVGVGGTYNVQLLVEHSSSAPQTGSIYSTYGRLRLMVTGSGGNDINVATDYFPFFDNDWWNVSFGVEEHPIGSVSNQVYTIRYAKIGEDADRITHSGSATGTMINVLGNLPWIGPHQDMVFGGTGSGEAQLSSSKATAYSAVQAYSGSMQEIRQWAEYIGDDAFYEHALSPISIVGDSAQMAYNDLLARHPLGTDSKTYDHTIVTGLSGSRPNDIMRYPFVSSSLDTYIDFFGTGSYFSYSPKSETYYVDVPYTAGPRAHSNKIRIEDNGLRGNMLSTEKSFETSSYDTNPLDTEEVSVALSPADQIDTDISMQFGAFSLADYIADPRDKYKPFYTSLRDTHNLYFKKHSGAYNVWSFIKLVNSMNKGLFRQMEALLPARADATVGIIIRPTILERNKLNSPLSMSLSTPFYSGSIQSGSQAYDVQKPNLIYNFKGDAPSAQTFYDERQGTHYAYTNYNAPINIGVRSSQQRVSGSSTYINRFVDGSEYITDVFGETTMSAVQPFISKSAIYSGEEDFKYVPTFNMFNTPTAFTAPVSQSVTGSGAKSMPSIYPKSIDILPNYLSSPAQRRLVYEGTRVTSAEFNAPSTQTLDGGPVVEYKLVNPNTVLRDVRHNKFRKDRPMAPSQQVRVR